MLDTREKIIFGLVRQNGQQFKELIKSANTNHDSLSRGLKGLLKDNLIVKDKDKYYFSTNIKNKILKSLGSSYTLAKSLDSFAYSLERDDNPFPESIRKISEILRLQIILRLERFATPKLTKREKLEFDLYFDIFDATLGWIFDILRKKDLKKTQQLKLSLFNSMRNYK